MARTSSLGRHDVVETWRTGTRTGTATGKGATQASTFALQVDEGPLGLPPSPSALKHHVSAEDGAQSDDEEDAFVYPAPGSSTSSALPISSLPRSRSPPASSSALATTPTVRSISDGHTSSIGDDESGTTPTPKGRSMSKGSREWNGGAIGAEGAKKTNPWRMAVEDDGERLFSKGFDASSATISTSAGLSPQAASQEWGRPESSTRRSRTSSTSFPAPPSASASDMPSGGAELAAARPSRSPVDDAETPNPGMAGSRTYHEMESSVASQGSSPIGVLETRSKASEPGPVDRATLTARIQEAALKGDLSSLRTLFFASPLPPDNSSPFALANEPKSGTGTTPVMLAAGRGHLECVKFLVNECGAMVEIEDAEGETALHKAALRGHLQVLKYLLPRPSSRDSNPSDLPLAKVGQADHDGWTALHGACSRGFLDIVRYLVEDSGAEVDVRSRAGYTPLMNAASRGHLPIVKYLTARRSPDPFIRNAHGETAYDVAAATFETHICDVLASYEARCWGARLNALSSPSSTTTASEDPDVRGSYNPLALHTTVAIVLHENQRLDLRIGSLAGIAAKGGGTPNFKASALSRNDNRAPYTLPPAYGGINPTQEHVAVTKAGIGLPQAEQPFVLVIEPAQGDQDRGTVAEGKRPDRQLDRPVKERTASSSSLRSTRSRRSTTITAASPSLPAPPAAIDRSHFWLSDWQTDLTSPSVDPSEGWQYAPSFDAPAESWTPDRPAELERLLEAGTAVLKDRVGVKWVRRRRWVRVCRRRLDRPPLPFADVDELDDFYDDLEDLGRNYVGRARYLAGSQGKMDSDGLSVRSGLTATPAGADVLSKADLRRTIGKLETAVSELRAGLERDDDANRRRTAESLVETFTARLESLRGRLGDDDEVSDDEADEFHYPGVPVGEASSAASVPSSSHRDSGSDYFTRLPASESSLRTPGGRVPDLTPQLALAPEFRVPTHEQATTKVTIRPSVSQRSRHGLAIPIETQPRWERDGEVGACRRCNRRFTFFVRKHHCRRCGLIVCAHCSSNQDHLDPSEVVHEPGVPEPLGLLAIASGGDMFFRTCDACHAALAMPSSLRSPSLEHLGIGNRGGETSSSSSLSGDATAHRDRGMSDAASDVSELSECPVCGQTLATLGGKAEQEDHVRVCLEDGGGAAQPTGRYLVFVLGQGSPLIGTECEICFESLAIGSKIGRLSCLCFFHADCIGAWLSRGHGCPVHSSRFL